MYNISVKLRLRRSWPIFSLLCLIAVIGLSATRAEEIWPDLSQPVKAAGGGAKDAAVIIGLENYAAVAKVGGARQNAEDWQAFLTDSLKVPADRVALLRDNEATLEAIREYAAQKASEVEAGGTLWFVFIGHGAPSKDGKDGMLVGWDAQQRADSLFARSIPRGELLGLLSRGRQAKTVVLIDACFSGRSSSGEALVKDLQPLVLTGGRVEGLDARTIVLTAAKSDQFAGSLPRAGKPRPAFSYLALGALRGWASDSSGKVTAGGVVDFARRALKLGKDRIQTPELTAGPADAVLSLGNEPSPDLAKIDRAGPPHAAGAPDFHVSSLPAVPSAATPRDLDAGASGLDLGNADVESLEKYDAAVKLDKGESSPEEKTKSWLALAKAAPAYASLAAKRASEWGRYGAERKAEDQARKKRIAARDSDWKRLARLLALSVVSDSDKKTWASRFVEAYVESPGIGVAAASELSRHLPSGAANDALKHAGMALIPEGDYWWGSPDGEGESNEHPRSKGHHEAFYMDKFDVTVEDFDACVKAGACSYAKNEYDSESCNWGAPGREKHPINCVDRDQADKYCEWRGKVLPDSGYWQMAARGGAETKFPFGDDEAAAGAYAWYQANSGGGTHPVGEKKPNQYGLYDMVGNVRQWVRDLGPDVTFTVYGCSFENSAYSCRPAYHYHAPLQQRDAGLGLRCAVW